MDKESLHDLFDAMWPKLKTAIDTALDGASLTQEPQRSLEDMAAEVVDAVRRMERTGDGSVGEIQCCWIRTKIYCGTGMAVKTRGSPQAKHHGLDCLGRIFLDVCISALTDRWRIRLPPTRIDSGRSE